MTKEFLKGGDNSKKKEAGIFNKFAEGASGWVTRNGIGRLDSYFSTEVTETVSIEDVVEAVAVAFGVLVGEKKMRPDRVVNTLAPIISEVFMRVIKDEPPDRDFLEALDQVNFLFEALSQHGRDPEIANAGFKVLNSNLKKRLQEERSLDPASEAVVRIFALKKAMKFTDESIEAGTERFSDKKES